MKQEKGPSRPSIPSTDFTKPPHNTYARSAKTVKIKVGDIEIDAPEKVELPTRVHWSEGLTSVTANAVKNEEPQEAEEAV